MTAEPVNREALALATILRQWISDCDDAGFYSGSMIPAFPFTTKEAATVAGLLETLSRPDAERAEAGDDRS